jgi:hypothetical protein
MNSKSLTLSSHVDCQACQAKLADYVRLELDGQAAAQAYPEVAFHIETCDQCEAAYYREFRAQGQNKSLAELRQIGGRAQVVGALEQILAAPAPDPSWRQIALDHGRAWLDQETGRWRQVWLSLATLGGGPRAAPALAGLMTDGIQEPSPVQESLDVAPIGADFEIKLNVVSEPTSAGEVLCRVDVALTLKNRFGDFSGAQVTLLWGDTAHTQQTDALGKVSFSGLPCNQLDFMSLMVVFPV